MKNYVSRSSNEAAYAEIIFRGNNRQTDSGSRVIIMLDEDSAGRAARDEISACLSKLCFVRTIVFDKPDTQPDQLSSEELQQIAGGML